MVSRQIIIEYAKSLVSVPTINAATGSLSSLLRDEEVSFPRLSNRISYDPGLSFRLIGAANSPWYNRGNPVTSVNVAISILGLDEVRNLVMCAILYDGLLKKSGLRKKDAREFWTHSLMTAFATRKLADRNGGNRDETFTAGLLHDIGKVPFFVNPELRSASITTWHRAVEKERGKFGIDHCEVGFLMAREWKLPENYQNAIRFHHEERLWGHRAESLAHMVGDADALVTSETEDAESRALLVAIREEAQGVIAIFSR
jgi:putative nucleotidyltransferase with HDIG domain